MGNTETDRRRSSLWDRILESLEEDLAERRARSKRAEEHRERRERANFVLDMRAAVDQLQAGELAEMAEAPRSRRVA
jgi:hypothetical protein